MTTPLERILAAEAASDPNEPQTIHEWLRANGGTRPEGRETLATLAARTADGEDFFFALRELLDAVYGLFPEHQRVALIRDRPQDLDPHLDAFLGALAEHFAALDGLERPAWAVEPARFLDHLWFVTDYPGFYPIMVVESPAAFRRRGVMISASRLQRM